MQSLFIPQWDELIFSGAPLALAEPYPAVPCCPSGSCLCAESLHSLPGSSVHGILQAYILEWVVISWDLPDPGIKPGSPALQADSLPLNHWGSPLSGAGDIFENTLLS